MRNTFSSTNSLCAAIGQISYFGQHGFIEINTQNNETTSPSSLAFVFRLEVAKTLTRNAGICIYHHQAVSLFTSALAIFGQATLLGQVRKLCIGNMLRSDQYFGTRDENSMHYVSLVIRDIQQFEPYMEFVARCSQV